MQVMPEDAQNEVSVVYRATRPWAESRTVPEGVLCSKNQADFELKTNQ